MYAFAIHHDRAEQHLDLLTEMFEFRRRVLHNQERKPLIGEGLGLDIYDTLQPTYLLAMSDNADLVGCVRLLPTTGRTMLRDRFAAPFESGHVPSGPTVLESSYFCVDTKGDPAFERNRLSRAAYVLLAAIIETMWNLSARSIVMLTDMGTECDLNRAGWPMRRLASPQLSGGTMVLPGLLHGSGEALDCMYRHADVQGPVLLS